MTALLPLPFGLRCVAYTATRSAGYTCLPARCTVYIYWFAQFRCLYVRVRLVLRLPGCGYTGSAVRCLYAVYTTLQFTAVLHTVPRVTCVYLYLYLTFCTYTAGYRLYRHTPAFCVYVCWLVGSFTFPVTRLHTVTVLRTYPGWLYAFCRLRFRTVRYRRTPHRSAVDTPHLRLVCLPFYLHLTCTLLRFYPIPFPPALPFGYYRVHTRLYVLTFTRLRFLPTHTHWFTVTRLRLPPFAFTTALYLLPAVAVAIRWFWITVTRHHSCHVCGSPRFDTCRLPLPAVPYRYTAAGSGSTLHYGCWFTFTCVCRLCVTRLPVTRGCVRWLRLVTTCCTLFTRCCIYTAVGSRLGSFAATGLHTVLHRFPVPHLTVHSCCRWVLRSAFVAAACHTRVALRFTAAGLHHGYFAVHGWVYRLRLVTV